MSLIRSQRLDGQPVPGATILKSTWKDILYLFWILVACILLDCALFRLEGQLFHLVDNHHFYDWIRGIIFQLRIYIPLILFSLIIQIRVFKTEFTAKKLFFLLISLWLFNEIAYEFSLAVRTYLFELILAPINDQTYFYIFESILGTGLIACYFLGYYCAMVAPFKLQEDEI